MENGSESIIQKSILRIYILIQYVVQYLIFEFNFCNLFAYYIIRILHVTIAQN